MNTFTKHLSKVFTAAALCGAAISANALTLTFDEPGIKHGTIINDQYSDLGVSIYADNLYQRPWNDRAVAFDTTRKRSRDPDLQLNPVDFPDVGNVLIIQENNWCNREKCFRPDDEGRRPAGSLFFEFDKAIDSLSFSYLDIETPETSTVKLYDGTNTLVKSVDFGDLSGATFGDNNYATVGAIALAGLGIQKVEFALGGSGALDDITVSQVPVPASLGILLMGLLGLQFARRRMLKKVS